MSKTNIDDIKMRQRQYHGIYRGVIEDNHDPEKMGRCRIRIWGIHDDIKVQTPKQGIPTDQLHWAEPVLGLLEGSVTGNGMFSVPLQGSHVFLFFENGNWESPRYFATVPALPTEAPDPSTGFNDPDAEYPRTDRLNEPDYHRLAREDIADTNVEWKIEALDLAVPIALGGTWDELPPAYAAEYPHNIVFNTHKDIMFEIDNTDGEERVHLYHPSNSYIEIDKDGNMVFRNNKERVEITLDNRKKHIWKDDHECVDMHKTSKIGLTEKREIGLSQDEYIGTYRYTNIGSNDTKDVGGNWTVNVAGNITITAGGTITIKGASINLNP